MISDIQSVEECYYAEWLVNKEAGHWKRAKDWVCLHVNSPTQHSRLFFWRSRVPLSSLYGACPHTIFSGTHVVQFFLLLGQQVCRGGSDGLKFLLQEVVCSGVKICCE
jgi:hypothetical protein